MQISRLSPIHSLVVPEFTKFCNATPMVKRLLIGDKGISFFSKVGFMNELARGEVVWRPLANAKINKIEVGILPPRTARCRT